MQGKRFVASNMRQALKMVREELGPDAVILSNRQVPQGVELVTAVANATMSGTEMTAQNTVRRSDNPFVQTDNTDPDTRLSDSFSPPSKLEIETDKMRQNARQRARALADALTKKRVTPTESASSNEQATSSYSRQIPPAYNHVVNTTATDAAPVTGTTVTGTTTTAPTAHMTSTADATQIRHVTQTTSAQTKHCPDTTNSTNTINTPHINGVTDTPEHQAAPAGTNVNINETVTTHATQPECNNIQEQTAPSTQPHTVAGQAVELAQMRNELQSMRDLLEQQLSSMAWGQFSHSNPEKASLWRRLKRMGITARVADSLLNHSHCSKSADAWQQMMVNLSQQLPVVSDNMLASGGVFAFVGPAGAGKTTTIAKLATQYVLKQGAAGVALVTTDTLRVAAQEQLRTVARIVNVPVKVVDKHNTLDRVLFSLRHKSLILIDTAGLNCTDTRLAQQLDAINELGNRVKTLLVIPTTSQARVIKAAYHGYKTDNLAGCILTKLDETASLGESMCIAIEKHLPIAYCTHGQSIPQDITVADKTALVKEAIKLAGHTRVDDDVMADEMASMAHTQ